MLIYFSNTPLGTISITSGPIVGWGSSTVKDVANGNAATISGTVAPDLALSTSVSAPVDGNSIESARFHVDPVYGQVPATVFIGGGAGTAYGSIGGGVSHVYAWSIINLSP
jgi:hypothetical protein